MIYLLSIIISIHNEKRWFHPLPQKKNASEAIVRRASWKVAERLELQAGFSGCSSPLLGGWESTWISAWLRECFSKTVGDTKIRWNFTWKYLEVKNHCSSQLETTFVSSQLSKFADWGLLKFYWWYADGSTWWGVGELFLKNQLNIFDGRKWQSSDEETLIQSQSAIQVVSGWKDWTLFSVVSVLWWTQGLMGLVLWCELAIGGGAKVLHMADERSFRRISSRWMIFPSYFQTNKKIPWNSII